jgi:hypothetical protein
VRLPHLYPLALLNKLLSDVRLAALLNIPIMAQTLICHRQGAVYRLLGLRLRDDDVKARATFTIVC